MRQTTTFEETLRKSADLWSRHDVEGLLRLHAPDAVLYDPVFPEPQRGQEAIRKDIESTFKGLPDLRITAENIMPTSDGKTIASEWTLTGTNTGLLEMPTGETYPPTNKRVSLHGALFVRFNDQGLFAEVRRYYDMGSFIQQLGLMPGA